MTPEEQRIKNAIAKAYGITVDDIEKARGKVKKIGELDKAGKNIKTANGWVPVKKHAAAQKEEAEEKPLKGLPVNKAELRSLLSDVLKGRDFKINSISEYDRNYDRFSDWGYEAHITLNDAGTSDVTPSGTFHSRRGIDVTFYVRGSERIVGSENQSIKKFTTNASFSSVGGMSIFNEATATSKASIKQYAKNIFNSRSLRPNQTKNFVY